MWHAKQAQTTYRELQIEVYEKGVAWLHSSKRSVLMLEIVRNSQTLLASPTDMPSAVSPYSPHGHTVGRQKEVWES